MADAPRATRFINRELSWLAFNERVLEEAADPTNPLLERLKFVVITASNLDEFFMVRVAGLQEAVADGDASPDLAGMTPGQQLAAIASRAHAMVDSLYALVAGELLPALAERGIHIFACDELTADRQASLAAYARGEVLPVLTPLAIDVSRPFPLVSSLSLNLAVLLDAVPGQTEKRLAIVQVPPVMTRLVRLSHEHGCAFVLLEDLIRSHLPDLFPGQSILEAAAVRLARDAEMAFDDEGGRTRLEVVEREVRRRRHSDVVRLGVEAVASEELVERLTNQLDLEPEDVYLIRGPLDLRVLTALVELPGFDDLRDPPLRPVASLTTEQQADMLSTLEDRDVLLHHPYDAHEPVAAFVAQAADDPDVLAIKQTLYRTSGKSAIITSLQRAANRGKQVTVLVELTARFDEEQNIQWARALEEAGAHVIYGIRGYKTHAKICLVVRRVPQGLRRYVHLGTGNYNERTARAYTDFSLMTASPVIAEDASAFFSALTGYSDPPHLKKLVMAPTELRGRLLKLISRERRRAEAGQPAEILAKMNSLIDEDLIEALYEASRAGVRIRLNVRGICALRPGLPGTSEHIEVVSIVDRFLEHSRVFCFHNGGDNDVYLSSADWMTRNLDKRIELMFPVADPRCKEKALYALRAAFRDNVKARLLGADGVYRRRTPASGEASFRVQLHLYDQAKRAEASTRDRAAVQFQPESNHESS
jgi:polyphosphate kinase